MTADRKARLREEMRRRLAAKKDRSHEIGRASREGRLPLSFAQQRLWFLDRLDSGRADYNSAFCLDLRGELSAGALGRAFAALVHRHESLRTTFAEADGEGVQVVHEAGAAAQNVRIEAVDAPEDPEELNRLVQEHFAAPFDLERGPLLRVHLFRVAERRHVLLVVMHHIVIDGWSMGVLRKELDVLYRTADGDASLAPGGLAAAAGLSEPALQYADYAVWQRERLTGPRYASSLAHWKRRLDGAGPLQLPTDRPRPPVRGTSGDSHRFRLPAAMAEAMARAAAERGANLFMVLTAGVQLVLSRWTRSDDVVVGTVVAGRDNPQLSELVGFFVNTVALRGRVDEQQSFGELLETVKDGVLADLDHADIPFDAVVDAVLDERDSSTPPLVQAAVVLQNLDGGRGAALGGLDVHDFPLRREHSVFDLTFEFHEDADGIDCSLEYNSEIFDGATVALLAGQLAEALAGACADRPLRETDLGGGALPVTSDLTAPAPRTMPALFAEHVAATPGAPALLFDGGELSYAGLHERAGRFASYLLERGLRRGEFVGVCLERGPDLVTALLGIMRAGGVYLPLDPGYPAERLAYMAEDSGVRTVVTRTGLGAGLPGSVERILLDEAAGDIAAADPAPADSGIGVHDAAYVIYTSGSTGRPKGVVVTHHGIAALAATQRERLGIGPQDRIIQFASPSFDAAIAELVLALLNGAAAVVLPREELAGEGLPRALRAYGVTQATLPPALLPSLTPDDLGPVRVLMVAGEATPGEVVARFSAGRRMHNGYGPTESTVAATLSGPLSGGGIPPIGTAVAGARVRLLDPWLRPVAPGVPGEVYIAGDGLARGYWNRPGLTAERFVADPFGPPGARMYRSGDVARRRADGELEFLGRVDDQVKVRGHRIELGEIESTLTRLPGVAQAAVVLRRAGGENRLVAHVVPEAAGTDLGPDVLRAAAAEVLPDYMVPSAFSLLDRLPLTANGKIDRKALPDVDWAGQSGTGYTAPGTATEEILAGVWAGLLGLERVGIHDNFFRVGGDSISGIRLISRIADATGVRMPARALFDHPTIAAFGAALDAATAGGGSAADRITPAPREGELPLSYAQRRLWFLNEFDPGGSEYNSGGALRLSGPLDVAALRTALDALVHRHESLRTVFASRSGEPVQVIRPPHPVELPVADLRGMDPDARDAEVERLLSEGVQQPFALDEGPLLRLLLVALGPEEHVLLLAIHHIVTDAWSTSVITRELGLLYHAALDGPGASAAEIAGSADLPELPVQYADFAVWQQRRLSGEQPAASLEYWQRRLDGAVPLDLPADHERPQVLGTAGAVHTFEVPENVLAGLHRLGRDHDTTLFMTLTAAVQLLLARWTGQRDITVGTVTSGRDRAELESVVGFFINTLALRTQVDESATVAGLLAAVRETVLGAFEHGEVPFDRVVEAVAPERDPSRPTLVQAVVALQNAPGGAAVLDGLEIGEHPLTRVHSLFELSVDFGEVDGRLLGSVEYSTELFEAATVVRFTEQLATLLANLAGQPAGPLHEVPSLPEAERAALPAAADGPALVTGDGHALDGLTAAALAHPEQPALTGGGTTLSFREAEERVNRLARHLIGAGVGPGRTVAVCLPRTPDAVVAIFAVLRAGGAYVPVDPGYPAERIRTILGQAGPVHLLATAATAPVLRAVEPGLPLTVLDDERTAAVLRALDASPVTDRDRPVPLMPDHPAYAMYTSGSTGTPKGVVVSHGNLANAVGGYRATVLEGLAGKGQLTAAHLAAWSFDASWDPLVWLLEGHHLHVIDEETRLDAQGLCAYLDTHRIDYFDTTPSYLTQLVDAGLLDEGRYRRTAVTVGAEALDAALAARLFASGVEVCHNFYGPTENTVNSVQWPVRPAQRPLIGRPMPGVRALVLDAWLRPVPVGVHGELYLGGGSVAQGYSGRPDLTAERFVADPGGSGERLYRTGDIVRWTPDHELEFIGRADSQVKVRGFRIELGEIEAALAAQPGVAQAAVVVREETSGPKRLVGYAVGDGLSAGDLRAGLAAVLPEYMVPSAIVLLPALPLTANGKLDRRALPAPSLEAFATGDHIAPRTPTERKLAEVWAALLGLERVGAEDNFFELGGDSILSIQLVSRARKAGLVFTSKDVFVRQTVAALAAAVDEAGEPDGAAVPEAEQGAVTGDVGLTPVQRWFLETHPQAPEHFDMSLLVETADGVGAGLLEQALAALAEHHDMLRLRVECEDGRWSQRIVPVAETGPLLRRVDAAHTSDAELEQLVAEEAGRTRDPERLCSGPLFEAVLFDGDGTRRSRLLLTAHHMVVDGVTWRLLLEDLALAHAQLEAGKPVDLGAKSSSFQQWAARLTGHVADGGFDAEAAHWAAVAEGALAEVPVDHPGGANTVASQQAVTVALSAEHTRLLVQEAPAAFRSRIDDVLLAALGRAFDRWAGSSRVLVELEGHGREELFDDIDLSRTAGWFTTVYPVVLDVSAGDPCKRAVGAVKRQLRRIPNRGIGFGALRHLGDERQAAPLRGLPQAPVSFNYLGQFGGATEGDGFYHAFLPSPGGDHAPGELRTNVLDVTGSVAGDRMEFTWTYSANLHRPETVEEVAGLFAANLREIAEASATARK